MTQPKGPNLRILILNSEETLSATIQRSAEAYGAKATLSSPKLALEEDPGYFGKFEIIIIDPSQGQTTELIHHIKSDSPGAVIFGASRSGSVDDIVKAINIGCHNYLKLPASGKQIFDTFLATKDKTKSDQSSSNQSSSEKNYATDGDLIFEAQRKIIGRSEGIQKILDLIKRLSMVDTSVLIRGESGTGKELVARAIHQNSSRRNGPFVAINCAAIPDNLIESELFGHEKGTFTGADKKKTGKFLHANQGTIFLDEIGDVSSQMQIKILRALQERIITPVGSNAEIPVDIRVLSATNRPLEKMIEDNTFRPDLFYRLNVLPVFLPPLRDRREDIQMLSEKIITKFNQIHGLKVKELSKNAMTALKLYSWPGNIRELENVIEHGFILSQSNKMELQDLPAHIQNQLGDNNNFPAPLHTASHQKPSLDILTDFTNLKYPVLKEKFEKEFLTRAMKAFHGKINQTSEHTQMTKVTLLRKLEKYGINPRDFQ